MLSIETTKRFPKCPEDIVDAAEIDTWNAEYMFRSIYAVVNDLHQQAHVNQSLDIRHCYLSPCKDIL